MRIGWDAHSTKREFCLKLITPRLPAGSREIREMSGLRTKVGTTCGRVLLPWKNFSWQTLSRFHVPSLSVCTRHLFSFHCCYHKSKIRIRPRKWKKGLRTQSRKKTNQIWFFSEWVRPLLFFWKGAGCSLSVGTSPPRWAWSLKAKQNTNSNKQNISQNAKLTQ